MPIFVSRAEYDRLYREKVEEARRRFAPLPLASLELQWVGDQMQEYEVLDDSPSLNPHSDDAFMEWLQRANPSWRHEFSGTVRGLYEAWLAGREYEHEMWRLGTG